MRAWGGRRPRRGPEGGEVREKGVRRSQVCTAVSTLLVFLLLPVEGLAAGPPGSPPPAPGPSAKRSEDRLIAELAVSQTTALALQRSLAHAELQMLALGQQILESDRELARLSDRLDQVRGQRQVVMAQLEIDRRQLAVLVRRLYTARDRFLKALIRSGGFGEMIRAIGYSEAALERETALVKSLRRDELALEQTEAALEQTRRSQQTALERLETARAELAEQVGAQQLLLTALQEAIDEALSALAALEPDVPSAARQRVRLIELRTDALRAQSEQAAWTNGGSLSWQPEAIDSRRVSRAGVAWPIHKATITQAFGPSSLAFEPSYAGFAHFHTGIDLASAGGTPVLAAADGVVSGARQMTNPAGNLVGYGNFVILQHPAGLKTLYGHLQTILVREGQTVKRGQLVGLVGSTGNSTGTHTHFEVRVDNTPVDPLNLLAPPPEPLL